MQDDGQALFDDFVAEIDIHQSTLGLGNCFAERLIIYLLPALDRSDRATATPGTSLAPF